MNTNTYNNYKRAVRKNYSVDKAEGSIDSFVRPQVSPEEARELEGMYRSFFGRGDYKFGIYPSYWKDSWGRAPLLGIVYADNEFLAEKLAYDRGVLPTPFNCTFQPKIKNLGPNRGK